jgi:hypothetical protein
MKNESRIRFNPVTKEIEIEGSEAFVKKYFDKLHAMISDNQFAKNPAKTGYRSKAKASAGKTPPRPALAYRDTTKKGAPNLKKRVTQTGSVVGLIQESAEGISTSVLKKKTGLAERQIWSIVNRAAQEGKIRKVKRGLYAAT